MERRKLRPRNPRKPYRLNRQQLSNVMESMRRTLSLVGTELETMTPVAWVTDPSNFSDPYSFACSYLGSEVLSKMDDGKPSPSKSTTTWNRFFEAEELCRSTNERLRKPSFGPNPFDGRSPYSAIMLARQKMETLLGPLNIDEVSRGFAWGPGATTRLSRRKAAASNKFHGRPEATIGNAVLATAAIAAVPGWKSSLEFEEGSGYVKIVPGNRIVTVPKNYKTDRTIAIEPDMNMYVQKGFGRVIRSRLKRAGVDLDDQSKNQRLARVGSYAGTLATIDLSMASDTISYELVRLLLPPDWFDALEQCRSPLGVLPSGVSDVTYIRYQKFSSMGNGYTFELESAIFFCLALAVAELHREKDVRISVYGDDIIVPIRIALPLLEVLEVAGFKPNTKKTFINGPFRESCGKHFFDGYDVTPFYIKRVPTSLTDLFLLHNQIYRWCCRVSDYASVRSFRPIIDRLRKLAPPSWCQPRIPDDFGDGAFMGTFDEAQPIKAPHSLEGFLVVHLAGISRPAKVQPCHNGRLLSSLYQLERRADPDTPVSGDVPDVPRVKAVRSLVPQFALLDPFGL